MGLPPQLELLAIFSYCLIGEAIANRIGTHINL